MAKSETVPDDQRRSLLYELSRGAELIFRNAEQLFQEAEALKNIGAFARSLFLHQISIEECAKIEMVGGWATSMLMGYPVDLNTLVAKFQRHEAKNHINAYMTPMTAGELEARECGDWKKSIAAFKKFQTQFHAELNSTKNASLYVDFKEAKFSAPSEFITNEVLRIYHEMNQFHLRASVPKLSMLQKYAKDDGSIQKDLQQFKDRANQIRLEFQDNPERAMEELLNAMLATHEKDDKRGETPL